MKRLYGKETDFISFLQQGLFLSVLSVWCGFLIISDAIRFDMNYDFCF
jgi:hypothetical protein